MVNLAQERQSSAQGESRTVALPSRLPSLTGMRFIAAALVFFYHSTWIWQNLFASPNAKGNTFALFSQGGSAGVGFFFVLSGFVLTWAIRPKDTPATFWRRRFFKIYPNHLVTFVAAAILIGASSKYVIDGWYAVSNLLLVQSYFPQIAIRNNFNPVAWSLSCEALFYLSFPFLMAAIGRIRAERLWFWAGGVAAAIIAIPTVAALLPEKPAFPGMGFDEADLWFIFQFPPVRMLEFVFGIILARIVLSGRKLPLGVGGAVALSVAAYAMAPLFPGTYSFAALMVIPLGLVIAAGAAADVNGERTWLASRPMVWLGEVSFAFYMCHYLILMYSHDWFGADRSYGTPGAIAVLAGLFGATLLAAWLLYSFVERPLMRRLSTARRPATESV